MRIKTDASCMLVIDLQMKLLPHMAGHDDLIRQCCTLLKGVKLLKLPMVYTEQYPKGLGRTDDRIEELLAPIVPIEKRSFSCWGEPEVVSRLQALEKTTIIIIGIEAHVCVLQTVLDCCEAGYLPVVVADCITSRNVSDKQVALDRMRSVGACITSTESLLFELMGSARHPVFRDISKLVK